MQLGSMEIAKASSEIVCLWSKVCLLSILIDIEAAATCKALAPLCYSTAEVIEPAQPYQLGVKRHRGVNTSGTTLYFDKYTVDEDGLFEYDFGFSEMDNGCFKCAKPGHNHTECKNAANPGAVRRL
jgi:hypothetical protein